MRRPAIAACVGGCLLLFVGASVAISASTMSGARMYWRKGVAAVLPANASTSPSGNLFSVSCPSAGNCSAVGFYDEGSGNVEGLLVTERAGKWGASVEAPLPANAATTNQFVRLDSVSCASAGNCSAGGIYTDNSGLTQGLLLTETAGKWAAGVEAVPPPNAETRKGAFPLSVSCSSAGNCTAVGNYSAQPPQPGSVNPQGLLMTETAGKWGAGVEAPLPANATQPTEASLSSVSCPSAGNCSAVGAYVDSSGCHGLLLTETAGSWTTGVAALPANPPGCNLPDIASNSVSCSSAGNCGAAIGVLLTERKGRWGKGVKVVLPANACPVGPGPGQCDSNFSGVYSISCGSAGNCSAVSGYTDSSGGEEGLLLTERVGRWRAGVEPPLPANAAGKDARYVTLYSVSCASAGRCSAVGSYTNDSVNPGTDGLLLTEAAGNWTAAKAALPANAGSQHGVTLESVSCATAGRCSAVGAYTDSSGLRGYGLLLDSVPLAPCVVPRLQGLALAAAMRSTRSHACSLGTIRHAPSPTIKKGHVISQRPQPGKRLHYGAKINLVLSTGQQGRAGT